MGELYKLNFSNGKSYIGIAFASAQTRFIRHRREAMRGKVNALYNAWRKHGEPNLQVLAIIETHLLHEMEIRAISTYRSFSSAGYNMTLGGEGTSGWVPNQEFRDRVKAQMVALNANPEFLEQNRARSSTRMTAQHADPEFQKRHSARMTALNADPEFQKRNSARGKASMTALNANLEFQKRHSARGKASMTALIADPVRKKQQMAGLERFWAERRAAKAAKMADPEYVKQQKAANAARSAKGRAKKKAAKAAELKQAA